MVRPFIIAEAGSNWLTFEDCKHSVAMAAQCGADAVKFQLFTKEDLYGLGPGGLGDYNETLDEGMPEGLPPAWLPKLKEKADACGIEFMCTAFSPEGVRTVDPFVKRHKIASSDLTYPELLETARGTGKPLIISTGASSFSDIDQALSFIGKESVTLLYCVASYPARHHNLFGINQLKSKFGLPVGLSDHSRDIIYTPLAASQFHEAVVIEKHFTAIDATDTPDHGHSLTVSEFKTMVDYIRGKRLDVVFPCPEERDMILKHNRRLIATTSIRAGDRLTYGKNFGCYRSLKEDTNGLTGFAWRIVDGCPAAKNIEPGDSIGPSEVVRKS